MRFGLHIIGSYEAATTYTGGVTRNPIYAIAIFVSIHGRISITCLAFVEHWWDLHLHPAQQTSDHRTLHTPPSHKQKTIPAMVFSKEDASRSRFLGDGKDA
jgi:hypothetical protein